MQKYHDIVLDNAGNAVLGATITVSDNGGGVSTIYSDNGVTPLANPFTASSVDGAYSFYAANGRYDINISATGFDTENLTDVALFDYNDNTVRQTFDTVAAMKLESLAAGLEVTTKGYYAAGDGGDATYLIKAPQAFDGYGDHELANSNIAVLQTVRPLDVRLFGAKLDGTTDDKLPIQAALNAANGGAVYVAGRASISGVLYIDDALATGATGISARGIIGEPLRIPKFFTHASEIFSTATTEYIIHSKEPSVYFRDIAFQFSTDDIYTAVYLENNTTAEDVDAKFENCGFSDAEKCIHLVGRGLNVHGCTFESSDVGIYLDFPATIDASADFGQQSDDAFRGITIRDNRFHALNLSAIENIGAQAADVLAMNIADNQCDGATQVFFRGGARYSKFTGNVIHNLNADQYGFRFTLPVTDTLIANNVLIGKASATAVEADLPNYAIHFADTVDNVVINSNHLSRFVVSGMFFNSTVDNATITGNFFNDTAINSTARRAIVFNGASNHTTVTGNSFYQPTGAAVDYFIGYLSTFLDAQESANTYDATRHLGVSSKGITQLANSATPSVEGDTLFETGGTTTITDFTESHTGHIFTIFSNHAITITDGTNIFLNGSANFVMKATDTLTLMTYSNGNFVEVSRSVN